eukprot:97344_1
MESNDDRILSHYLWSLDNALSGLIGLCNGKPDTSARIIKQVEDKLNVWNQHVTNAHAPIDTHTITNATNTSSIAWGDCSDEEDTNNENAKEAHKPQDEENIDLNHIDAAWGDCSDEEDNDLNSFILADATGLCAASTNHEEEKEKEAQEDDIKETESHVIQEETESTVAQEDIEESAVILDMVQTEEAMPLFIDDTRQKTELTWAQRTKPNGIEATTSSSPATRKKKRKKKKLAKKGEADGWSRVYRSKKNKILRRNKSRMSSAKVSQQQRLFVAESKKKKQILERQQKHATILSAMNQKLFEKEKKEKSKLLQKKRKSKERLKKAEEKRKKTDLLRKEKAIKDDVRREEIRIFQEWQQHEKKSAIVEKQVAAEIRKLKMAQKLTQKLSFTEQRFRRKLPLQRDIVRLDNWCNEYFDATQIVMNIVHKSSPMQRLISAATKGGIACDALHKLLGAADAAADLSDNDALIAIDRLTQFDLCLMSAKCSKLLIQCLRIFCVNRRGCRLLGCKYLDQLLQFLIECVAKRRNNSALCLLISRVLNECDDEQCCAKYLFDVYNADIFSLICGVFKSYDPMLCDGFISILIATMNAASLSQETKMYCLMKQQLDATKCGGILSFLSKLVFCSSSSHFCAQSVTLLNGAIAYLNCVCKMNGEMLNMLQRHILEYEMEIYHILLVLFSLFIKSNHDKMRELCCKGLLEFITFCATNNEQIQDMFRAISSNKPTLIKQLTQFPFFFFIHKEGKLSLYPTLIAITQTNPKNLDILKQTFNTKLIKTWIKQNIFECIKNDNTNLTFKQKVPVKIWANCLKIY